LLRIVAADFILGISRPSRAHRLAAADYPGTCSYSSLRLNLEISIDFCRQIGVVIGVRRFRIGVVSFFYVNPVLFEINGVLADGKYLLGDCTFSQAVQVTKVLLTCRPPANGRLVLALEVGGTETGIVFVVARLGPGGGDSGQGFELGCAAGHHTAEGASHFLDTRTSLINTLLQRGV